MIGDVLASTVICESIKKKYPKAEVHYLIENKTLPVVENNPFIDRIIFFDSKQHKGFLNLYKFGKQLKHENYDIVIDAFCKWQSIIPSYFSGAKKRIGHYKWYSKLFSFLITK